MSREYTKHVGTKFYADGKVRTFPGNSIICRLEEHHELRQELAWVQQQFKNLPFAYKYGFLPPESFHMTVFELVCDQVRKPEYWSKYLPLDAPLEKTDVFFREQLSELKFSTDFTMEFAELRVGGGISVALVPDHKTKSEIRAFRDELAHLTGIRQPNHAGYVFHITLAYNLILLDQDEREEVNRLGSQLDTRLRESIAVVEPDLPRLVYFEDMFSFPLKRSSM